MQTATRRIDSPIGELTVTASNEGLIAVSLHEAPVARSEAEPAPALSWVDMACRELQAYFAGAQKKFTVPIVLEGTLFQQAVWTELRRIPYGQTATYQTIAGRVGRSGAARAVGGACGRNPLLLVVPCHRVLAQRGLGGFTGGLNVKEQLLQLEGVTSPG